SRLEARPTRPHRPRQPHRTGAPPRTRRGVEAGQRVLQYPGRGRRSTRSRPSAFALGMGVHARGRGKTRHDVNDAACFPALTVEMPADRSALWLEGGDQVLIAAISGATPRIVIIRLML